MLWLNTHLAWLANFENPSIERINGFQFKYDSKLVNNDQTRQGMQKFLSVF
jgi:hypothetical protein